MFESLKRCGKRESTPQDDDEQSRQLAGEIRQAGRRVTGQPGQWRNTESLNADA